MRLETRVFRLLDMVRMKGCQWDARFELGCINLGESATSVGGKVFEKPALCALRALLKARTDSVQLWEAGRFREIIPALLLPFTPCPRPLTFFLRQVGCP